MGSCNSKVGKALLCSGCSYTATDKQPVEVDSFPPLGWVKVVDCSGQPRQGIISQVIDLGFTMSWHLNINSLTSHLLYPTSPMWGSQSDLVAAVTKTLWVSLQLFISCREG
jgi:hypothetical protein